MGIGHVCVGMGAHGCNLKRKCRALRPSELSFKRVPHELSSISMRSIQVYDDFVLSRCSQTSFNKVSSD